MKENATVKVQKQLSWCGFWHQLAVKSSLIKPNATASKAQGATKKFSGLVLSAEYNRADSILP